MYFHGDIQINRGQINVGNNYRIIADRHLMIMTS